MPVSATVILDSISEAGIRLTTMELRYPRSIHSEFMTHRVLSRNASSSRAVPVEKLIDEAMNDPAYPARWGSHAKGMQDGGALTIFGEKTAKQDWLTARDAAVAVARTMLLRPERPAKQIINRILEPFTHITVVVTSTQWGNFYALRDHPDADPTMQALAVAVIAARQASIPRTIPMGGWHLPYIDDRAFDQCFEMVFRALGPNDVLTVDMAAARTLTLAAKVSAARCARVSYLTHDGKRPTIQEDMALFTRLVDNPMHASPLEHQATPDEILAGPSVDGPGERRVWGNAQYHGNFVGWQQHRKFYIGEAVHDYARILDPRR